MTKTSYLEIINLLLFFSGIRLFDDAIGFEVRSTDVEESKALVHEIESVDIYSNSWGPGDFGLEVEGPGPLTSEAIKHGIEKVSLFIAFCLRTGFQVEWNYKENRRVMRAERGLREKRVEPAHCFLVPTIHDIMICLVRLLTVI